MKDVSSMTDFPPTGKYQIEAKDLYTLYEKYAKHSMTFNEFISEYNFELFDD